MTAESNVSPQDLEGGGRGRVRLSVRGRVLASVLAMTALGMAVTGSTAFQIQDRLVNAGITVTLEQEVQEFRRMAASGVDPQTGDPFTSVESLLRFAIDGNVPHRNETYLTLLDGTVLGHEGGARPIKLESEASIMAAVADAARSPGVSIHDVRTSAGRARLAIVPVGLLDDPASGTYVMAFAVDRGRDDLVKVALIYLLASLGSLILVGIVGWLVAGRLLKPLRTLRESSQRINETDLTERIPVQGNDDISEPTRTYNQMLDRLQVAIDTQRRFLDDAGHELRTPLTILRGQMDVLDPADPFDVTETRSLLLDKARALGDRHWSLHEPGDTQFVGDAHRLTQAMMELARNAVEISAVGSAISIGSRAAAGEVRLWVSDAGAGIRAGELDRVFERFSRASSGLGVEGSGLGLSIVEAIATAHLGHVEVVSEPGVGSTFTIVLPQPGAGPALRPSSMRKDATWSAP